MAHVRKDTLTRTVEWWKHLRGRKHDQARRERIAARGQIRTELDELALNNATALEGFKRTDSEEIFAAGWEAACQRNSGLLISHGVIDWRTGFAEAYKAFCAGSARPIK